MIQAHAHVYATARSCRAQPGGQLPRRRKSETNPMTARTKTTTMTMKIVPMTNLSLDPAAAEEKHDEDNDHEDEEEATRSVAIRMIPKTRPRPNAPKSEKDHQDTQQ
jgi:hypothetical protein